MIMSEIPFWVNWIVKHDKYENTYEDCLGIVHTKKRNDFADVSANKSEHYYCDFEINKKKQPQLTMYDVLYSDYQGFYASEVCSIVCNQYKEIIVYGNEKIAKMLLSEKAKNLFPHSVNAVYAFVCETYKRIFPEQETGLSLFDINLDNVWGWLALFTFNGTQLLIRLSDYAGMENNEVLFSYLNHLLKTHEEPMLFSKRMIQLAYDYQINLRDAVILCSSHNFSEVMKFAKVICYFGGKQKCQTIFSIMAQPDNNRQITNFAKFCDYFLKQTIVYGRFHLEDRKSRSAERWLQNYFDYLKMLSVMDNNEDADYFPLHMEQAHNQLILSVSRDDYATTYKFLLAVKEYEHYQWENGNWNIVVPKKAEDLKTEGEKLHNCLKNYIDNIEEKISQICFLQYNEKPYAAIEVRDGKIYQALQTCNSPLDKMAAEIISKWALEKDLEFTGCIM